MNLHDPTRPTMRLRCRNKVIKSHHGIGGDRVVGVIEQLHVNDDLTRWRWVEVPLVSSDAPMEGEGTPDDAL